MTATAPEIDPVDDGTPHPVMASVQGSVQCKAELTEDSAGWHLTLRFASADPIDGVLGQLRPGLHPQVPGRCTVEVSPNLVPGHPFELVDIQVISEPLGLAEEQQ